MRVISGKYKGLKFPTAKGFTVRPTTDRAKESLFNLLINRFPLEDFTITDLFTGTGNMAVEFLSRGVKNVVSVDIAYKSKVYHQSIQQKLNDDSWKFIKMDGLQYLKSTSELSDIVFADPPYLFGKHQMLIDLFYEHSSTKDSILILEHPSHLTFSHDGLIETRRYGQSAFSLFQKHPELSS